MIYDKIYDLIGNTPIVKLEFDELKEYGSLYLKLEWFNPGGSVKDRIAISMINAAERDGLLKPGDTIVEASSGNTGNAMSMVAAVKGYKMLVIMPDGMSLERTAISEAFGAEVHKMGDFHVNDALAEAKRLGDLPGYFSPQQFDNEQNVDENRDWLGQEILEQMPALPDLVIGGVGTGGTIIGVGKAFKAVNPNCKVIALEPSESCTILCGEVSKHLIEGIADGFIPGIVTRHHHELDGIIDVHSDVAIEEMRRIARVHGIFVGPSSGAHLLAAKRLKEQYKVENVVTFFCDEGEKYINDYWIKK